MDDWPDCSVPGCTWKSCRALNSDKCFQHTDGNEHVKRMKIDARNASPEEAWRFEPDTFEYAGIKIVCDPSVPPGRVHIKHGDGRIDDLPFP